LIHSTAAISRATGIEAAPALIVNCRILATKAGVPVETALLAAHHLAGGDVQAVVRGLVAAHVAGVVLDVDVLAAIDLAGEDPQRFGFLCRETTRAARQIGEALKANLPPGSDVFLLTPLPNEFLGSETLQQFLRQSLAEGLGHEQWEMVGSFGPVTGAVAAQCVPEAVRRAEAEQEGDAEPPAQGTPPVSADELSRILGACDREIHAIVSFDGLPEDWPEAPFLREEPRPVVAALFPPDADRARLRQWLLDGVLQAAVMGGKPLTRNALP